MTDPVFYLDNKEYGRNISFREMRLRAGHVHVLSFVSSPKADLNDLKAESNPFLPLKTEGNRIRVDLTNADLKRKYILTRKSETYHFSFTYLLHVLPFRKKEDFIGRYASVKSKRRSIEFYKDSTGMIFLKSFLGLRDDIRILGFDFDYKKSVRNLVLPRETSSEGDKVSYLSYLRYDNEKEGFFVSLKEKIERADSYYQEARNLLGSDTEKEFFRKTNPYGKEA